MKVLAKTTARPDRFVALTWEVRLVPRRTSSVLSRDSLRGFARSGLLATFLLRTSVRIEGARP
jgi:hypothetical protein